MYFFTVPVSGTVMIASTGYLFHLSSYQQMNKPQTHDQAYQQTAAYTKIAEVYDRMMLHVNYPRWAAYIEAMLRRADFDSESALLDIGCGTGRFLRQIYKFGFNGDGCDPSPEMLEIARKRLPQAQFYPCGFPELAQIPEEKYSIITSLYDTINYLPDTDALEQSLNCVYQKLKPPGIFIFDAVTRLNCQHYFKNYSDKEQFDEKTAYFRESYYDGKEHVQYNWIRIHTENGKFEEMHRQYIFSFREIKKVIQQKTKFELAHCYDDFTFHKANRRSGRIHFVLRKG